MKRDFIIHLILALVIMTTGLLNVSCDRQKEPDFTVGVLNPNPGTRQISQGFMDGLKARAAKAGYRVLFIESECEKICDIDAALENLLARKVDLIFTVTTPATRKAQKITQAKNIPVIFAVFDPVSAGIIKDRVRPGGNLTGVLIRGNISKALEWLLIVKNDIKHLYVPIKFDTEAASQSLSDFKRAAAFLDKKITVAEVNTKEELAEALATMPADVDALFLLHSIFVSSNATQIALAAIERKLPLGAALEKCDNGALISFSSRLPKIGNQTSRLAHLVLRGESAGDIPCEIVEFFLEVNPDTAKKIGIALPDNILEQQEKFPR